MRSDPEVEEYIDQFDPAQREILSRLRELIYEVVPDATEAIKWRVPTFSLQKNICYIAGFKNHVTLAFYNGNMLTDPDGVLLGTGRYLKYLKFRSLDELDEDSLRRWFVEGFYV